MKLLLYIYLTGFIITAIWMAKAKIGLILGTIGAIFWPIAIFMLISGWKERDN